MYLFMGLAMLIPLETVSNNFDYIGMNASVAKKIDEILKLDEMADTTSKAELADHTIAFEHVTFSYGEEQPVLKDVSFTVPDGKVTALAGVSGSGKKYSGQPDLPVLGYNRGTDLYGRRTAEPDSAIRSDVPDFCDPEYVPVQKEHPG